MRYSKIVHRLDGSGYHAWDVHGKAKAMLAQGADVILLTIGDPDFATPSPIIDTAIASLRQGRTHYTPSLGEMPLRTAIAAHHQKTSGQATTSANVAVVAGAQCGLYVAAMAVLQTGDEVILPEPVYSTYEPVVGATGATPVYVKLRRELGFHFDPVEMAAAITPRTRAILINTPHNPTGAMLHPEELEALADLSTRHDLWIISDEVYSNFSYTRPHLSPANLPALAERSIVISSLSKSHAMTGWRLGWTIAPAELTNHIGNLLAAMLFGQPPFIQDAALHALTHELAEAKQMRDTYRARRNLVCTALNEAGNVNCYEPEGGMYVLVDVRKTGMSSYDFGHALLEAEKVGLLPGEAFGTTLAGYLRLSLTAPEATLAEACQRIQRFAASLAR
ncbi:arginine--pyruvate transaminase AruH [soil metagenome]